MYRPRTPAGWRIAAFATALAGGTLALAAAAAGETAVAVHLGLRVLGVGLAGMGVATAAVDASEPADGPVAARLRAVALVGIGAVLAVAPATVAVLAGP